MNNESEKLFGMRDLFPNAESLFSYSLRPVEEIMADCLVVLDTNVLLIPYNTGKTTLDQISKIYKRLIDKKRLIVPGQVAREFAKNRGQKISDLFQRISIKRNQTARLNRDDYPLLESLKEYKAMMELEEEINKKLSNYNKSISKLLEQIQLWQWNDPVIKLYKELFSTSVVVDIDVNNNEIQEELIRRNKHKIPPGYKDAAKSDGGVGDLIIWYTILTIAKQQKKSVIFVSGEEKADWQIRSENQTLCPRYELVDEFRQQTSGASFHMLSFSKFLSLFGADPSVVLEVSGEENQESDFESFSKRDLIYFNALYDWLVGNYPDQYVKKSADNVEIEIIYSDGSKIGVDVVIMPSAITQDQLNNIILNNSHLLKTNQYKNLIVAIIVQIQHHELKLLKLIETNQIVVEPNIALLIGHVSSNFMFRMVYFA